jgi:hypothetical protein
MCCAVVNFDVKSLNMSATSKVLRKVAVKVIPAGIWGARKYTDRTAVMAPFSGRSFSSVIV